MKLFTIMLQVVTGTLMWQIRNILIWLHVSKDVMFVQNVMSIDMSIS